MESNRTAGHPTARAEEALVGQSVHRKEDLRLLTGTGRFVDDLRLSGMLYARILRSPYAHARIVHVDTSEAEKMPGVHAVLTGKDIEGKVEPWGDFNQDLLVGNRTAFGIDKVMYEGQEIAAVLAESTYQAMDAVEAIHVEYDVLPVVIDPEQAILESAPIIQEGLSYEYGDGRNVFDTFDLKTGDVDKLAEEDDVLVVRQRFTSGRVAGAALESHGCVAHFDPFTGILTLHSSTQMVYILRDILAKVLHLARHKIRVIATDVGAGFGSKAECFPHEIIACILSMRVGRPVKIMLDRAEVFLVGTARCGQVRYAELHVKRDGTFVGYKDRVIHNVGGTSAWGNQTVRIGSQIGILPYSIPNVDVECYMVYTNQAPGGALRGFGVVQTLWAKEQLVDMAAEKLGMDPVEIRLKNAIKGADCPFTTSIGQVVDTTSMDRCIKKAAEAIGWEDRRRNPKPNVGLGFAICMKYTSCRHPSVDSDCDGIRVRMETDGTVSVFSSGVPHGQGHETMLAQIVGDLLGVNFMKIRVISADTDRVPFGLGTFGSRSAAILGTAARMASEKIRDKILQVASHILEAPAEDLELGDDRVYVKGVSGMGLHLENIAGFIAYRTHQLPPGFGTGGLEEEASFDSPTERPDGQGRGNWSATYSGAAHAAVVEVDTGTGALTILDYAMAHDSGTVINPLIVRGQHDGSFLHGVGMAMFEGYVYDDNGHLLNATFKDYYAPYAADLPELDKSYEIPAPSTVIPGGQKGAGETATGPVPPAIGNAVYDAIGVRFAQLPITPDKVLLALREKERRGVASFVYPDDMPDFKGRKTWSEETVKNVKKEMVL